MTVSEEKIAQIKSLNSEGYSGRQIAEITKLSSTTVSFYIREAEAKRPRRPRITVGLPVADPVWFERKLTKARLMAGK